ncbi:DUF6894 family protein [Methylobacterium gossipiicola]|uniref:DUF6894 family protein n=1 Tax=Methylobacterium gossipiicola TaxID=582675 RepID=UPI003CC79D90
MRCRTPRQRWRASPSWASSRLWPMRGSGVEEMVRTAGDPSYQCNSLKNWCFSAALTALCSGLCSGWRDPSHAWRHRFKTLARAARINDSVADAIVGHALDSVARKDEEGSELESCEVVRLEATELCGALLREYPVRIAVGEDWRMEVPDERGLILFRLGFQVVETSAMLEASRLAGASQV